MKLAWTLLVCLPAAAQSLAAPAPLIQLIRQIVPPGNDAGYEKTQTAATLAMSKAHPPGQGSFGLWAYAMPDTWEVWFLSFFESYAEIDAFERAMAAAPSKVSKEMDRLEHKLFQVTTSERDLVARYRADLSYLPGNAVKMLPRTRYLNFTIFNARPGWDDELAEMLRTELSGRQDSHSDQSALTYEVVFGNRNPTYLIIEPLTSLVGIENILESQSAVRQALGASKWAAVQLAQRQILNSRESWLMRIDAPTSMVTSEFAAGDPAFWKSSARQDSPKPYK